MMSMFQKMAIAAVVVRMQHPCSVPKRTKCGPALLHSHHHFIHASTRSSSLANEHRNGNGL